MILIDDLIEGFSSQFVSQEKQPWEIIQMISSLVSDQVSSCGNGYKISDGIAIHESAVIENNVTLKSPVIIGPNCFLAANAYLRGGVWLMPGVNVGPGCEIKSSIIFSNCSIAHFNFIGDSIIGNSVNFEAGSVTANHYNERRDKRIKVLYNGKIIETNIQKFGSLVGDNSAIGANAVLSPGTILKRGTIVKRLELIEQVIY